MDVNDCMQRVIFASKQTERQMFLSEHAAMEAKGLRIAKINEKHIWRHGPKIINDLRNRRLKVFLDGKYCNTEDELREIITEIAPFKPTMVNCMAESGLGPMTAFAQVCTDNDIIPVAVTVLTTKTDAECKAMYGRTCAEQVMFYAKQAVKAGITTIVCSGLELSLLKNDPATKDVNTIVCGARSKGTPRGNQKRTVTPKQLFQSGGTYGVFGTELTYAGDPVENLEQLRFQLGHEKSATL